MAMVSLVNDMQFNVEHNTHARMVGENGAQKQLEISEEAFKFSGRISRKVILTETIAFVRLHGVSIFAFRALRSAEALSASISTSCSMTEQLLYSIQCIYFFKIEIVHKSTHKYKKIIKFKVLSLPIGLLRDFLQNCTI